MSMRPLEHPKNELFSKIAPKQIYFWPYSIKGSCLEYQKPQLEMVIDLWPGVRSGGQWESSLLQQSKIEDILRFYPDHPAAHH